MKGLAGIAAAVALIAYAVYLATQNTAPVELELLFASPSSPAWAVVLGSFVLGVVVMVLAFSWPLLRLRLVARRQSRQIARLEQEVHGLRTLPLEPDDPVSRPRAEEG